MLQTKDYGAQRLQSKIKWLPVFIIIQSLTLTFFPQDFLHVETEAAAVAAAEAFPPAAAVADSEVDAAAIGAAVAVEVKTLGYKET